ncbi:MAG: SPFH domain-containing protein [Candidatus Sumerlaeia bacterium]|nr:SPFH domain-containing protein [Candidatus Sumerlaeia bacterium]
MSSLTEILGTLFRWAYRLVMVVLVLIKGVLWTIFSDPIILGATLFALARLLGTVVETGSKAVIFTFGRFTKEGDHGFHWLIPGIQIPKHIRVRSATMDLPPQRATTVDGFVYQFDINIVYRIDSARAALIEVNNVGEAIANITQQCALSVIARCTRHDVQSREFLNEELRDEITRPLGRYGVYIEHAGFQTIAPTHQTLRVTQVSVIVHERLSVYQQYRAAGLDEEDALHLVGATRIPANHLHLKVLRRAESSRRRRKIVNYERRVQTSAQRLIRQWQAQGYLIGPEGEAGSINRPRP